MLILVIWKKPVLSSALPISSIGNDEKPRNISWNVLKPVWQFTGVAENFLCGLRCGINGPVLEEDCFDSMQQNCVRRFP